MSSTRTDKFMILSSSVQSHPASVDAYIRHGWSLVAIPPGSKGPAQKHWNLRQNMLRSQTELPPEHGIGLAHAYSGTMALDIDDWTTAVTMLALHGINLQSYYDAPDAVIIDSSRPGHGKLLYAMPDGLVLPSKKLVTTRPDKSLYNYLDFRCGTANDATVQDVLPPTIHPEMRQPYRWAGRGHWSRLPLIPEPLLKIWQELIEIDQRVVIRTDTPIATSWIEIQKALEFITPDCSRADWVTVGMALHYAGAVTSQSDQGYSLWDEWSRGSVAKYPGERTMRSQWQSFRDDKPTAVKVGSLFFLAGQGGWARAAPDVTGLFSSVAAPAPPADITAILRPAPPDINLDLFPPVLAQRAREVAAAMGADPLVPLFAGLGAVCGAVDAQSRLQLLDGFKVPPVLWLMTIGDPSEKKSPASKPMFSALAELEHEDRPKFAQDMQAWEAQEAAHASSKKAFLEWAGSAASMLQDPKDAPEVRDLARQPVPLRIKVTDITSQKLVRHAADRPRGLLCHLDEMAGWAKKLIDKTSGEDRSAWVVSYESDAYDMDRVGAGSIHCDNLAVSIYGNLQPDVFREACPFLTNDGLLQRFIPVVLRNKRWGVGEPMPDALTSRNRWDMTLRLIYSLPRMDYVLSADAYKVFRKFQHWYDDAKYDERILGAGTAYMTAFGKLEGTVGRLALVWHLIESPFSLTVSGDLMERVVDFVRGYVIPSFRYALGELSGTIGGSLEVWLSDYVTQMAVETPTVSLASLRRSARRLLDGKSGHIANIMLMDGMVHLEQSRWVMRVEDNPAQGKVTWAINPAIATLFADHRKEVIRAKQRHADYIYRIAAQRKGDEFQRKFVKGYDESLDG